MFGKRASFSGALLMENGSKFSTPIELEHSKRPAGLELPWPVYAMAWARNGPIACGSYSEDANNRIMIIDTQTVEHECHLSRGAEAKVDFPCTNVKWSPDTTETATNTLFASSSEFMRIWNYDTTTQSIVTKCVLMPKMKSNGSVAPLTSFDWNAVDPSLLISSSVDTTCTIWDLNTQTAVTQLIAHDKEVLDVSFTVNSVDMFVSVGADGSARLFDLRSLDHSTIIYEHPRGKPLLRLAANIRDPNLFACIAADESTVYILDMRAPSAPVVELKGHSAAVNSVAWAPTQRNVIATSSDDCQSIIWDISAGRPEGQIGLAYSSPTGLELNNLSWEPRSSHIALASGKSIQTISV
ncbi:hypothetical protein CANCADRAFT_69145 [Tortispora caseinolytica NRRL Y-17796]|uniref:Uncharacterized protein n=1 Tax=Tortispora caseinolytica NRRL Y-17796 TaxID=767744 RepID=A0A1E4TH81_9ASCO|nr:hypothetical protein CANCADRAFT_69145 [Tortispora caseinolytica NRRL Y-17796]